MTVTDMKAPLSESVQHVVDHLHTLGYGKNIMMLLVTGKTSAEAVVGLGCPVAKVTRSIIFRRAEDDVPVPMITGGTNRVDEVKVSAHVGAPAKANAKSVRERTGYAIGGVCPTGHAAKPVMLLDQDLFQYDSLWAAVDRPHTVFNLMPAELGAMTGTPVADIAQRD